MEARRELLSWKTAIHGWFSTYNVAVDTCRRRQHDAHLARRNGDPLQVDRFFCIGLFFTHLSLHQIHRIYIWWCNQICGPKIFGQHTFHETADSNRGVTKRWQKHAL